MHPGPFGPFVLLEPIARGGMGEVWLAAAHAAHDAGLVVVKLTRADHAGSAEAKQRFLDESRVAVLLVHPCIARTIDAGRVDGHDYLALEAVAGINLVELDARMRAAHEPLPEHVALYIMACVLDALAFAHSAAHPVTGAPLGVVHRDVSPHNVMIDAEGNVKLIDFGVALSSLKQAQTEQGIVLGKMAYMAPEQARGDRIDARADLFAAGMMLYELMASERYYGALSPDEIWRVAGAGTFSPTRLQQLPADVQRVLSRALAADPAKRTQTAATMRAEVAGLLVTRGGAARAAADLAATVRRHAPAELERVARARAAAQTLPAEGPRSLASAESVAQLERRAVTRALATRVMEPVTLRLEALAAAPAAAERDELPARVAAPGREQVMTARVLRAARVSTEPEPVARRGRARIGAGLVAGALAGIVAVGVAVTTLLVAQRTTGHVPGDAGANVSAPTPIEGAPPPPAPPLAPPPAPAAVSAPPPAPPMPMDGGDGAAVAAEPEAPPEQPLSERERLVRLSARLARCKLPCASVLGPAAEPTIRGADAKTLAALKGRITRCARECGP